MPILAPGLMSPISCMDMSLVEGVMGSVDLTPSYSNVTDAGEISTIVAIKVMEFAKSVSWSGSGVAWVDAGVGAIWGTAGSGAFWQPVTRHKSKQRAMDKTAIEPMNALGLGLSDGERFFFIMFFIMAGGLIFFEIKNDGVVDGQVVLIS